MVFPSMTWLRSSMHFDLKIKRESSVPTVLELSSLSNVRSASCPAIFTDPARSVLLADQELSLIKLLTKLLKQDSDNLLLWASVEIHLMALTLLTYFKNLLSTLKLKASLWLVKSEEKLNKWLVIGLRRITQRRNLL